MTRRPRFIRKAWWFHLPREYRRDHIRCCIDNEYCPVCRQPDPDCMDRCGCYDKNPESWRNENWLRMVERDPGLAELARGLHQGLRAQRAPEGPSKAFSVAYPFLLLILFFSVPLSIFSI